MNRMGTEDANRYTDFRTFLVSRYIVLRFVTCTNRFDTFVRSRQIGKHDVSTIQLFGVVSQYPVFYIKKYMFQKPVLCIHYWTGYHFTKALTHY